MSRSQEQVLDYLTQIETLSNTLLADKRALVDLDKEKNKNREALREFRLLDKKGESKKNSYCLFGNTFMKLPTNLIQENLRKEQEVLDREIEKIRDGLPAKASRLKEAEGSRLNSGFSLKSVNK